MITKAIIEGMQIILKYYNEDDGYQTGADHDVICMYSTDKPVSEEDYDHLISLGWYQGAIINPRSYQESYNQGESWMAEV